MLILTHENKPFDLTFVGHELKEDIHYAVLDYSVPEEDIDYYFPPLVMLENFNSVAIKLTIGGKQFQVPGEWSIVVSDPECHDVEVVMAEELLMRDFHAFVINPLSGIIPSCEPIFVEEFFPETGWVIPRLNGHNFLVAPLNDDPKPPCVLLINEKDQKKLPILERSNLMIN